MRKFLGSKGAGEWSEVLLVVLLCACIMVVALQIPEMVGDVVALLTLESAEKTARDLGGLLTISGAATDSITIEYNTESGSVYYDISISDRYVHITDISTDAYGGVNGLSATMEKGWSKIGVGDITKELNNDNYITVTKQRSVNEEIVEDVFDVE